MIHPPETPRFAFRLPRPLWIGTAALVLIVVAAGLSFGLPIYRQQVALREIRRLGGQVEMRYSGPQWLLKLLGYERTRIFNFISVVRVGGTEFGDSDMKFLTGLGSVEHLVLFDTRITDSALMHVGRVGRVKRLYLYGTRVTDAGINSLTALTDLRVLDLSGTEVTDAGLMQLRELKSLERIYVDGTHITDTGVAELQRALPGLKVRQ